MRSLDMQQVQNRKVDFDDIEDWPAVRFETSYDALIRVLARLTPSSFSRQPRQPVHITPPSQTTILVDPNFSSSTASSSESKPEHFTDLLAHEFVQASLKVLKSITGNIPWLNPDLGFYLSMTCVSLSRYIDV